MMVGGAIVSTLAFSGSNFLFSKLSGDGGAGAERERHDKAIEQLQAARDEWSRRRTKRLDWINEEMRRQGHAVRTFHDVDEAMRQYSLLVGGPRMSPLGPEPMLSDFYSPSPARSRNGLCGSGLGGHCGRSPFHAEVGQRRTEKGGGSLRGCPLFSGGEMAMPRLCARGPHKGPRLFCGMQLETDQVVKISRKK